MIERRKSMSRLASVSIAIVFGVSLSACSQEPNETVVALPALNADIRQTSVSGISSGAYMAGQFEMAYADIVTGAAIIAGGPYGCSESIFADQVPGLGTPMLNLSKAVNGCMLDLLGLWGVANPETLAEKATARAERGEIAPIAQVRDDRVFLFSGKRDHTVVPSIVAAAAKFYSDLGVPDANIKFVNTVAAGHAFVTDDAGGACSVTSEPYVVDCDYDSAGALLSHIYGPLEPRSPSATGDYIAFDQRPFIDKIGTSGLADHGVVYVPKACQAESNCRVHVAFHGCAQNRATVGDTFVRQSGLTRWADTNHLIVLFPQVATTAFNPQGCWDWWGYTGKNYLTKAAAQPVAVRAMLETLGHPKVAR